MVNLKLHLRKERKSATNHSYLYIIYKYINIVHLIFHLFTEVYNITYQFEQKKLLFNLLTITQHYLPNNEESVSRL